MDLRAQNLSNINSRNSNFGDRRSTGQNLGYPARPADARPSSSPFGRDPMQPMSRVAFSPTRDIAVDPVERRHEELKAAIQMKERQLAELESERNTAERLRSKLGMHRTATELVSGAGTKQASPLRGNLDRNGQLAGFKSSHLRNISTTAGQTDQVGNSQAKREALDTRPGQQLQFYPSKLSRVEQVRPEIVQQPGLRQRSIGKSNEKHLGPNVTELDISATNSRVDLARNDVNDRSISPYQQTRGQRQSPLRGRSPIRSESPFMQQQTSMRADSLPKSIENRLRASSSPYRPMPPVLAATEVLGPRTLLNHGGTKNDIYRERIDVMNHDNESLQRRLNQVSLELSRIHQEKTDLLKQLCQFEKDNFNKEQALNMKDETDMHNQGLQEDLQRQKDLNEQLRQEVDLQTKDAVVQEDQIHNVTAAKSNLALESNNLNMQYTKLINKLDGVSRDRCEVIKELNNANLELDRLTASEHHLNHCNIDIDQQNQRIQLERQELINNLQNLTATFDDCVRDITRERKNMDRNNDRQTKLIVAKIIFQNLELFQMARMQNAFTDMNNYICFDKACQQKLRNFGNSCDRMGRWMLQKALHRWYDNTLKPLDLKRVNDDVCLMGRCNQLQAKVFYAWVQYNRDCSNVYNSKTNAVENMYHILKRNATCELKNAMSIWKGNKCYADLRYRKFQSLLSSRKKNELFEALMKWKQWSTYLEYQCRLRVTQITYSRRVFLSQCFSQMRIVIRHEKQRRIRTLNHFLKGWKDYIHYNRHLMQVNMAALRFGQVRRQLMLKNCLDELRNHNRQERYQRKYAQLRNEVDVSISNLTLFNKEKQSAMLAQSQLAAGEKISEMLGKGFYSYFYYWRSLNRHFQMNMQTKVKDQLLKLYKLNVKSSFGKWRDVIFQQINRKKTLELELLQQVCAQQTRDAEQGAAFLRQKDESLASQQSGMSDKIFRRLFYRKLLQAINRWKDIVRQKQNQEKQQKIIILRMHKRHLRQAFDGLLEFNKLFIQKQKNQKGAEYLRQILYMKRLRKNFNAICQRYDRDRRARGYWNRILNKMDKFMKMRALKIWNENANKVYEQAQNEHQLQLTSELQQLNTVIKQCEIEQQNRDNQMGGTSHEEKNMAYRTIGNTFMRQYMDSIRYTWKMWRQKVRDEKHKKQIMKNMIYHYKKNQMDYVKQVFKKFIHESKKAELQETTRKTMEEQEYTQLYIKNNMESSNKLRADMKELLAKQGNKSDIIQQRYHKIVEALSRRNSEWHYCYKQRAQLQMLQNVVRQETAFCLCIRDMITKNCKKVAFESIYQAFKIMKREDKVKRKMNIFFNKVKLKMFQIGFTNIKYGALSNANARDERMQEYTRLANMQFDQQVDKIKEANNARVFSYFMERNTANAFSALKNVTKFLRLQQAKTREFQYRSKKLRVTNALRRWRYRAEKTKYFKARVAQIKWNLVFKNYKASFFAWRGLTHGDFGYLNKLSSLQKNFGERMMQIAFKNIKSHAESRGLNIGNNKNYGGQQVARYLFSGYRGRLRAAWQKLKNKDSTFISQRQKIKMAYGKAISKRMRDAFDWWRVRHNFAELEAEMYETGPVRVQWWEAMQKISNLKKFMESERYTEDEIDDLYDHVHNTNETLLKKHVARWKCHSSKDKRLLPIVWQRWRYFCGNIKLMKFMMRNCFNNCRDDLSLKQLAFKRWRYKAAAIENGLSRMPAQTLVEMAVQTTRDVAECSETLAENQSIQNHLLVQRDEFLNYFIKGQVLAMAYVRDRAHFCEMQAISRWRWVVHGQRCVETRHDQQAADQELSELQSRRAYLEGNIPKLEKDNAEMKLFKTDAQTIRKNMERLQADRNRLKQKIDDSEQDYLDLINENERLQREVAEAEARAKSDKNPRFKETLAIKKEPTVQKTFAETDEQKKQRMRFEKLAKMTGGPSLR